MPKVSAAAPAPAPAATTSEPASPVGGTMSTYPRSRGARLLRDVLRRWWIVVGFIVASAIQTIGQILLQSGLAGLNPEGLRTTAIGHLANEHGPVFWPIAAVLVLLIPIGWIAQVDHGREQAALAEQRERTLHAQAIETVLHDRVAQSLALLGAPPLDLDRLLLPSHWVDRVAARAWLLDRLRAARGGETFAIEGLGGLGKTSLVAEVLRQTRDLKLFPGGIAVILCQGRSDAMPILRAALRRFSRGGVLDSVDDSDLGDMAQRILVGKRALVVLDNVEPELRLGDIVAPLKAASAVCVVTARFRVPAELCTDALRLDLLDEEDAIELFREYYGRPLSADDLTAVRRIVAETGCHTLATVLAAQYAADSDRALTALANELASADAVLNLSEDQRLRSDQDIRGVRLAFAQSYRALPEAAQHLFQALSVMPTADYSRSAAVAVGRDAGIAQPEAALDLLVRRALIEQFTPSGEGERLRQHPLLRAFATELAAPAIRDAAGRAMADDYLKYVQQHADEYQALDREYQNITGGLEWAHARADHPESSASAESTWALETVLGYLAGLREYLRLRGRIKDIGRFAPWGIEAARAAGNNELLAAFTTDLGIPYRYQSQWDEAKSRFEEGLALARATGSKPMEIFALGRLGDLAHARKDWEESIRLREQKQALQGELGDVAGQAYTLTSIGHVLSDTGVYDRARKSLDEALELAQRAHDTLTIAYANLMIGKLLRRQGKPDEALAFAMRAFDLYSQLGDIGSVGGALEELGWIEEALGNPAKAQTQWKQAAAIFDAMGINRGDYVRQNLLGKPLGEREDT